MPKISLGFGISVIASAILTPFIMSWWKRAAPPAKASEFDALGMDALRARNNRIDVIGTALSFCGLLTAFPFYFGRAHWNSPWPIGLGFGMMVIFPVTFFWAATRHGGIGRWREFWRFYELKWGVGIRGVSWVFVPAAILGIVSLVAILSDI